MKFLVQEGLSDLADEALTRMVGIANDRDGEFKGDPWHQRMGKIPYGRGTR